MTAAIEDCKSMVQESGTMRVGCPLTEEQLDVENVAAGTWLSFVFLDDEDKVEQVYVLTADLYWYTEYMNRKMEKRKANIVHKLMMNEEPDTQETFVKYTDVEKVGKISVDDVGIVVVGDAVHFGQIPEAVDENGLNRLLLSKWGSIYDEAKSAKQRFFELSAHLSIDGKLPYFGTSEHFLSAQIGAGKVLVGAITNKLTNEVEGLLLTCDD